MELQFVYAFPDSRVRSRQKARSHPVGDLAEAQVDASRLDLVVVKCTGRDDGAAPDKCCDDAVGQDALVVGAQIQRHGVASLVSQTLDGTSSAVTLVNALWRNPRTAIPHDAGFIIGPAESRTRWLHAGRSDLSDGRLDGKAWGAYELRCPVVI